LILDGSAAYDSFEPDQLETLALLSLDAHMYGYLIGLVCFGVHLALLGYLVYRSGFLRRFLGGLLGLAAFGYLVDSFTYFLVPGYDGALSGIVLAPAVIAALATIGWLLVIGVDVQRWEQRARPALAPDAGRPAPRHVQQDSST
jgi:hypothetical protein